MRVPIIIGILWAGISALAAGAHAQDPHAAQRAELVKLEAWVREQLTQGVSASARAGYAQLRDGWRALGDRDGEARALQGLSLAHARSGQPDSSLVHLRRALHLFREMEDRAGEAWTLHEIGVRHMDAERADSALINLREAARLRASGAEPQGKAVTLQALGIAHARSGNADSTLVHHARAATLLADAGDYRAAAWTYYQAGLLHRQQEDHASAAASLERSGKLYLQLGELQSAAGSLLEAGLAREAIGDREAALRELKRAHALRRQSADARGEAIAASWVGMLYLNHQQADSAAAYFHASLELFRELAFPTDIVTAVENLAVLHERAGRPDSTLVYRRELTDLYRQLGEVEREAASHFAVGLLYEAAGRPEPALGHFNRSLALRRGSGSPDEIVTRHKVGYMHYLLERPDSAIAQYQASLNIRRAAGEPDPAATLSNIALAHEMASRPDSALAYHRLAAPAYANEGNSRGEMLTLVEISKLFATDDRRQAIAASKRALALSRELGDRGVEAGVHHNLGLFHFEVGEAGPSYEHFTTALAIFRERGPRAQEALTLERLGRLEDSAWRIDAIDSGEARRRSAMERFREAARLYEELGEPSKAASSVVAIGNVYRGGINGMQMPDSARALYRKALETYRGAGNRVGMAATNGAIAGSFNTVSPDSAAFYWRRALEVLGDEPGAMRPTALAGLAGAYLALGRGSEALEAGRESLRLYEEAGERGSAVGDVLRTLGLVHQRNDSADSAVVYFARSNELAPSPIKVMVRDRSSEEGGGHEAFVGSAIDLATVRTALRQSRERGERGAEAVALLRLGQLQDAGGDPDSAAVYLRAGLELSRELRDLSGEAHALGEIGTFFSRLGRPDSAQAYLTRAGELARLAGDMETELAVLVNTGNLQHTLGRMDSARVYMQRALELADTEEARRTILNNLGFLHARAGDPDSARHYHVRVLASAYAHDDGKAKSAALNHLAQLHHDAGRADSALVYLQQSLKLTRSLGERGAEGYAQLAIGRAHRTLGTRDSALAAFRQGLEIAREVRAPILEAGLLVDLAGAVLDLSPAEPRRAVAYLDTATALVSRYRAGAVSDADRVSFGETFGGITRQWARAWLAREKEIGLNRSRRGAFAALEHGRAQALLDLLRGVQSRAPGANMVAEGEALLQRLARTGSATISYTLGRDTLEVWATLPSGELHLYRQAIPDTALATRITELRLALAVDDAARDPGVELENTPAGAARSARVSTRAVHSAALASLLQPLAELLLPKELLRRIPRGADVAIIPQGGLALLPFAALPTAGEPMGLRNRLRYAPSLEALLQAEERTAGSAAAGGGASVPRAVVVGDPSMPEVRDASGQLQKLAALPGAGAEAKAVARRLGVPLLSGEAATEAEVLRRLPAASMVHLATHGFAYGIEARVRDSFVALAPGEGRDGLLTVGEVLDEIPVLAADLVVLSACQTGLGDARRAEGTVGLQRAFLARGARSILVSLWSVSDEATERLMTSFYTHLLAEPGGTSKAEALRLAQEELRGEPGSRFHHPRYWAAFQLVGAQ